MKIQFEYGLDDPVHSALDLGLESDSDDNAEDDGISVSKECFLCGLTTSRDKMASCVICTLDAH